MKILIEEMRVPPRINLDDPMLPPDRREELLRVTQEVGADRLAAMGLEELLAHFDDAMAVWYWRWLGAGQDGRTIFSSKGTRSGSHARPRSSAWFDRDPFQG